jgi:transcriptional regulator with XRE-family HTH domain
MGANARQIRTTQERSQVDVAKQVGITQAALSNYETGKRELPLSTALQLAHVLNVPLHKLLPAPDEVAA